jgi:hypothetical protein
MKTTLDIDDRLLAQAKSAAALGRTTLTRLVEEGLALRLRATPSKGRRKRPRLPVFRGGDGLAPGINALSNKSFYEAEEA